MQNETTIPDAALQAAVKKAVEVGLLPKVLLGDEAFTKAWGGVEAVLQAALSAMNAPAPSTAHQQALATLATALPEAMEPINRPTSKPFCWCTTCRPITLMDMRFVVCPHCGNKRCPKATHHVLACTNSNDPGQAGSRFENAPSASSSFFSKAVQPVEADANLEHATSGVTASSHRPVVEANGVFDFSVHCNWSQAGSGFGQCSVHRRNNGRLVVDSETEFMGPDKVRSVLHAAVDAMIDNAVDAGTFDNDANKRD